VRRQRFRSSQKPLAGVPALNFDGFSFYVLDVQGLIKTKQSVRDKDRRDLEILNIMNAAAIEKPDPDVPIGPRFFRR